MFLFPLYRPNANHVPGISLIAQGPELVGDPPITVTLTKPNGTKVNLSVVTKRVKGDVMFIHARPGGGPPAAAPGDGVPVAAGADDGGVGSITVTVTGTTDGITSQIGYGDPSTGIPTSGGPPGKPPA